MKYLGHGYYRDVFGIRILKETVVFKTHSLYMRYKHQRLEQVRIDALVMERLTSAPNIVDIYGFCGFSVLTEALTVELQEKIVPGSGYIKQSDLHDEKELKPQNSYTGKEKLKMALEMAEAIASLHGFKDGVIVHDDIQLCQFLRNKAGVMKLNDFNRAEIMLFDEKKGEYCRYKNGSAYGNYRSPEEFSDSLLNEKIDIYSMGNNIYALLTGLWVFYENEDDEVVHDKLLSKNELPYIDPRYTTSRSYAEAQLVKVMLRCLVKDPDERADAFEVVDMLRYAVAENDRLSSIKIDKN